MSPQLRTELPDLLQRATEIEALSGVADLQAVTRLHPGLAVRRRPPVQAEPGGSQGWTTVTDLRALSLKAWNNGPLLRELLEPSGTYPRRRPLKGSDGGGPVRCAYQVY